MKKFSTFLFIFFLVSVAALVISIPSFNRALSNDDFRAQLLDRLASAIDGKLQATAVSVILDTKSLDISCKNLKGELLKSALSFEIPDSRIRISYISLLKGSLSADSLQLISPRISYTPPVVGTPKESNWSRSFNSLLSRLSGSIDISDGTLALGSTIFTKISIQTKRGKTSLTTMDLHTDILYDDSVIPVELSGTIDNPFLGSLSCNFNIQAKTLPLELIPASRDFFFSGGTADFSGRLSSNGDDIHIDGTTRINDLDMTVGWTSEDKTVHQEKKYRIALSSLQLQGDLQGQKITFSTLDLSSDTFHLLGRLTFDLNNRDNPAIDLRLKTDEMALATIKMLIPDPLINDWTTQTIFPQLENGTAQITNFVLAGTLDEIKRLDETEHAQCLSWSGIFRNVDTFYNDHKFLGRVHSALLGMDGDVLTIKELKGESGTSVLTLGNASISRLYDPVPILTTEVQGSFSLAWLTTLIKSELIGKGMQQLVSPISKVSGKVDGFLELSVGLDDDLKLNTLNSKGLVSLLDLQLGNLPFPITMKKADFKLAYPGTSVIVGKGTWGKTTFEGRLNLVDFNKKQEAHLQVLTDIFELKKTLTDNTTLHSLGPCISKLPLQAVFTAQNGVLSSSGSFDFNHFTSFDTPVCTQRLAENKLKQLNYALDFGKNELNIKKLVLKVIDGNLEVKGLIQTDSKTPLSIKKMSLRAEKFPVQSFVLLIPEQVDILDGTLDAELTSADFSLKNMWQSMNGNLKLSDWNGSLNQGIRGSTRELTLSMDTKSILLRGNDVRLADFNPETPLNLQVNLQKNDVLNGTILVYGKYLDISTLPRLVTKKKLQVDLPVSIGQIDIFIGFDQARFRNLDFSSMLLECRLQDDRFIISRYLLEQDDSFAWLTGHPQDDAVLYQSFFKIIENPVDSWMEIFGLKNDSITGSLNLEGKFTAMVKPGSVIIEKASGPLYAEIKKGTLKSSSTLVKLLDLISLENIFEKKDVLQWKDIFHFDLIQGRFDLHHGVFSTHSLIMDSPVFDIFAEGTIDMLQHTINMQLKMAPFGTISNFFSAIPYLGYVFTGKSGGLIDYSFIVKGKTESPDVQYIPLKGTFESLFGYVKRLVSERKKVEKEVNAFIKGDMLRQKIFKEDMREKLAPLHSKERNHIQKKK